MSSGQHYPSEVGNSRRRWRRWQRAYRFCSCFPSPPPWLHGAVLGRGLPCLGAAASRPGGRRPAPRRTGGRRRLCPTAPWCGSRRTWGGRRVAAPIECLPKSVARTARSTREHTAHGMMHTLQDQEDGAACQTTCRRIASWLVAALAVLTVHAGANPACFTPSFMYTAFQFVSCPAIQQPRPHTQPHTIIPPHPPGSGSLLHVQQHSLCTSCGSCSPQKGCSQKSFSQ